jgi:hypothetical protein
MTSYPLFQEFYAIFLRLATEGGISPHQYKFELYEKLTPDLQEDVRTYYNDNSIGATRFAQYCTTHDQQMRTTTKLREPKRVQGGLFKAKYAVKSPQANESLSKALVSYEGPTRPKPARTDKDLSTIKCYNCQEFGHFATSCPKPRTKKTQAKLSKIEPGLFGPYDPHLGSSSSSDEDSENDYP